MTKRNALYDYTVGIQQKMQLNWLGTKDITLEMSTENFAEEPYLKDLYQIRALMRKRFKNIDEEKSINYLKKCYNTGISIKGLKEVVLQCDTWHEWVLKCDDFLEDYKNLDEEDKVRLVLHDKDIDELRFRVEKQIESIIDELCENGFIRFKETEEELASIDISTRAGQIKADRLLNNLNVIEDIYKEISDTFIRLELKVEEGKIIPRIKL